MMSLQTQWFPYTMTVSLCQELAHLAIKSPYVRDKLV
jgi:hypothetical protein